MSDGHAPLIDRRDPALIERALPILRALLDRYHDVSITGLDRIPEGATLFVGNHNGGTMAPDMFAIMAAYWQRFGADAPAYGLMHDMVNRIPGIGDIMAKFGAVPASHENASTLLARGAKVLVYPGGDIDAFRPSSRRHEVIFGPRSGFIKVALRAGCPIVPVVSAGAHDGFHILTDGAQFARLSGLKRLTRIEVFPIILALPFGITGGPLLAYLPLPLRIKIRVLDPIRFPDLGPEAADDEAIVKRCRDHVHAAMQSALDDLVADGSVGRTWPSLSRLFGSKHS